MLVQSALLIFGYPDWKLFRDKIDKPSSSADSTKTATLHAVYTGETWNAPSLAELEKDPDHEQLLLGRELIANTSKYFGPKGSIAPISNGMNCQNCHLQAGTVPFGNNFGAVAATYPKYRGRSGRMEDVYKRIDDCFERSLNSKAPANGSREKEAIAAYINWLGKKEKKGEKPKGSGILELAYLDFNHGAGLYLLSRMAGYIKTNMPLGATYLQPQLTDEEAWDLAAYINSLPRPSKDLKKDWPKVEEKPVDHPFGPYTDSFSESQHKFGPFAEIAKRRK